MCALTALPVFYLIRQHLCFAPAKNLLFWAKNLAFAPVLSADHAKSEAAGRTHFATQANSLAMDCTITRGLELMTMPAVGGQLDRIALFIWSAV